MCPSFELVKYFIPVLFICKSHKNLIKITQAMLQTKKNVGFFWHSRASYSEVNSPIVSEFERLLDFMPVQVMCNFRKDPIKTKCYAPDKFKYGVCAALKGK